MSDILKIKVNDEWQSVIAMKGDKGDQGEQGIQGIQGIQGEQGPKGDDGQDGSIVTVSATGTSTDEVGYITIDGVEKKLAGGGSYTFTNGLTESGGTVSWDLNDRIKAGGTGDDYIYSTVIGNKGNKIAYQNGIAGGGYNGIKAGNASLAFGATRDIVQSYFNANGSGIIAGNIFGQSDSTYQGGAIAMGYAESGGLIKASGRGAIAVGYAQSKYDGNGIQATANGAVAMGEAYSGGQIKASSTGAVAMGCSFGNYFVEASGQGAFAIGDASNESQALRASGTASFAQGRGAQATGFGSVAHGYKSVASGNYATANGFVTLASSANQFVIGKRNIADSSGRYAFIIGNGTSDSARSNALTVDWNGNLQCNNIPAPPSSDGEYNLHCSIVNGAITYSWESAT